MLEAGGFTTYNYPSTSAMHGTSLIKPSEHTLYQMKSISHRLEKEGMSLEIVGL